MAISDDCARRRGAGAFRPAARRRKILQLLATIKRLQVALIAMTCDEFGESRSFDLPRSRAARAALRMTILEEAESVYFGGGGGRGFGLLDLAGGLSLGLAPTASTTTMLALGDALAVALSARRGLRKKILPIASWGKLGKRLARWRR